MLSCNTISQQKFREKKILYTDSIIFPISYECFRAYKNCTNTEYKFKGKVRSAELDEELNRKRNYNESLWDYRIYLVKEVKRIEIRRVKTFISDIVTF